MLKFFPITLVFLIVFLISSCSTSNKIAALKPEPDNANPLVYENSASFINLPISVKLKDVENQTNNALNGLIYEDNNIEDDDSYLSMKPEFGEESLQIVDDVSFSFLLVLSLKLGNEANDYFGLI